MEENQEVLKENQGMTVVQGLGAIGKKSNTKTEVFTNITDNKKLFNLESHIDILLNDCENVVIKVKDILIKRFEKPMKEPIINEETGEIIKDKEYTMSCILIDESEKSYATGSKTFTIQMMRYLQMFGLNEEGFIIRIVKNKTGNGNKALGFELV